MPAESCTQEIFQIEIILLRDFNALVGTDRQTEFS